MKERFLYDINRDVIEYKMEDVFYKAREELNPPTPKTTKEGE